MREAQHLRDIEENDYLKAYLKKPVESTILVFDYKYKKVDGRTEFAKLLAKTGVFFNSQPIRDYEIPDYIEKMMLANGYKILPETRMLLSESLGNDLSKIENEISKLFINVDKGSVISSQIVEDNIGISKDYNIFELQRALAEMNIEKANRIVNYFETNPKEFPAVMQIILLFGYFRKIFHYHFIKNKADNNGVAAALGVHPFFVKEYRAAALKYPPKKLRSIFSLFRQYDQKSKGVESAPIEDGQLMRELVYKILH